MSGAVEGIASAGMRSLICDAVPVPGCGFAVAGMVGYAKSSHQTYFPEPDYLVVTGSVTFYYRYGNKGSNPTLTTSGLVGSSPLTLYHSTIMR